MKSKWIPPPFKQKKPQDNHRELYQITHTAKNELALQKMVERSSRKFDMGKAHFDKFLNQMSMMNHSSVSCALSVVYMLVVQGENSLPFSSHALKGDC